MAPGDNHSLSRRAFLEPDSLFCNQEHGVRHRHRPHLMPFSFLSEEVHFLISPDIWGQDLDALSHHCTGQWAIGSRPSLTESCTCCILMLTGAMNPVSRGYELSHLLPAHVRSGRWGSGAPRIFSMAYPHTTLLRSAMHPSRTSSPSYW